MEAGKKILITGSEGFLASNLIVELKNRGYKELLLCNRKTSHKELANFTKECDVVFHLAGVNRPKSEDEFWKGNFEFTKELLCGLKENKTGKLKIIFSSSVQAELQNEYGKSKKEAENILFDFAEERNVKIFIYRLTNVFGKWCKPNYNNVVATFCSKIAKKEEIEIHNPNAYVNLIYIDDVVRKFIEHIDNNKILKTGFYSIEPIYKITVGDLAKKIYKFLEQRESLFITNMSDDFTKKLYSTYLSYLETGQFKYELVMKSDSRGSFTEFIKMKEYGQVSINVILPGETKGNHWHHTKVEKFLVVSGKASICFRHIITNEKIEFIVCGEKLEVINIPVGYTHNITNIGIENLVTVMWVNEIFDPKNQDTYFEKV